ncbi:MAG TPA: hypothetical protein VGN61_01845 [Verrucomicrobiae bacterium]
MDTPRITQVNGNGHKPELFQRKFNPTRIFVEKDRLVWFWFGFAMLVLVAAAVDRFYIVRAFKQQERIVVIDPSDTFYVSPVLDFKDARSLHAEQSTLAATAFFERNPKGFDNFPLLKAMFLKRALTKANICQAADEPEFQSKQLHQKAEISRIDILSTRDDFVLTEVSGQLVRNGIFEDQPFSETVPFKLLLRLQRNPDMAQNGRFPTAVNDFKYETIRN